MLTRKAYDLIFCDLDLPRKSGFEIVRVARALNRDARIVVTSALGEAGERSRMKKEGAFEFLDKPLRRTRILPWRARRCAEHPATTTSPAGRARGRSGTHPARMKETGDRKMESGDASPAVGTHPWQSIPRWREVGPENWLDWRWQARNIIRTFDELERGAPPAPGRAQEARADRRRVPLRDDAVICLPHRSGGSARPDPPAGRPLPGGGPFLRPRGRRSPARGGEVARSRPDAPVSGSRPPRHDELLLHVLPPLHAQTHLEETARAPRLARRSSRWWITCAATLRSGMPSSPAAIR